MPTTKPTPKPTPKKPVKKTYAQWGNRDPNKGLKANPKTGQTLPGAGSAPANASLPAVLGSSFAGFSALTRPAFWSRVGIFALGIALIWAGILIAIASNKKIQALAGSAIGGAVAKTPQGVAANLATGALA